MNIKSVKYLRNMSLDLFFFFEALQQEKFKLFEVSANEEKQRFHYRAVSSTGSFAFMIFNKNIFLPLNSRITTIVTANKLTTYRWLKSYGIPTIPTELVSSVNEDSIQKLLIKNSPLVVKTTQGQGGEQVKMNVTKLHEVTQFVHEHPGSSVIVQPEVCGNDYRLVFLNGELLAAVQRVPARVIGDGKSTVKALASKLDDSFEQLGRGRVLESRVLNKLTRDDLESVPNTGSEYYLTHVANFSLGATTFDVTQHVAHSTVEIIKPLLHDLGAKLIGVDILSPNISLPLTQEGAVIELNATPGMLGVAFATNQDKVPNRQIYSTIIKSIDKN